MCSVIDIEAEVMDHYLKVFGKVMDEVVVRGSCSVFIANEISI